MKRFITWVFLAIFIATSFSGLFAFPPTQVEAADPTFTKDEVKNSSFIWINRASIDLKIGDSSIRFVDRDINDMTTRMEAINYGCHAELYYYPTDRSKIDADFDYKEKGPISPSCINYPGDGGFRKYSIGNTADFQIYYVMQKDRKSIQRADGKGDWTFSSTSDPNLYLRNGEKGDKCRDTMVVDLGSSTFKLYELNDGKGENPPSEVRATSGCKYDDSPDFFEVKNNKSYQLGRLDNVNDPTAPAGVSGDDQAIDENAGEGAKTCEGTFSEDKLAWIGCAILKALDGSLNFLSKEVDDLLNIDADYYSDPQVKDIWARFRNLAYIILVPIILVMVIGTALGVGPFDAYGVRKALPRMIAAVIFIALSWNITQFAIELVNVLGGGISGLLTSTASGSGSDRLTALFNPPEGGLFTAVAVGGVTMGAAVGALSLPILGSLAITAVVALAIGYVLLTLRVMIIILLVVLAPLAILPWIFPGNDKLWKIWRGSFVNLLLVYPLIMLLIGSGQLFASVINNTDSLTAFDSTFKFIATLLAYIAPFFFIPAAFKFAGGAFGTLAGIANDRGKGIFDRQKKSRAERRAQGFQDFKTGDGNGRFRQTRVVKGVGTRVGAGAKGGFGFGNRGATAIGGNAMAASDERMKGKDWQASQFNDPVMRALSYGSEAAAARGLQQDYGMKKDEAEAAAKSANALGYGKTSQIAAARQLAMNKTGYNDVIDPSTGAVKKTGQQLAIEAAARAGGGNAGLATAVKENIKYSSKQVGRQDLGDLSGTSSPSQSAFKVADPITRVRQHGEGMDADLRDLRARAATAVSTGNTAEAVKLMSQFEEMKGYKSYATGDNETKIDSSLNSAEATALKTYLEGQVTGTEQVVQLDPSDPNKKVYSTRNVTEYDRARREARTPTPTQQNP